MLKRLLAIAAVFIFLFTTPAFAGQLFDSQTAIDNALSNPNLYRQHNENGDSLNYVSIPILSNYVKGNNCYGCLVYGNPHGDYSNGQHRYLGYTLNCEEYTNVAFPPDVSHSGYLEDQQWIYWPWGDNNVKNSYTLDNWHELDGSNEYALNIKHGIMVYYMDSANTNNYEIGGEAAYPDFWADIHQRVHILSPPTDYSWGIGRMFRYGNNGINYMTVPILPNLLVPDVGNLKAVSIDLGVPAGQKAEPDTKYTATVVFTNESAEAMLGTPVAVLHGQYQATLYDENGNMLPKKTVNGKEVQVADFDKEGIPGATRTFTCEWHPFPQPEDGLTGIINHDEIGRVHQETTYEDNRVSAKVNIDMALNLVALGIHPGVSGEAEPGASYTATVDFKNDSDKTLIGVPVGGFNREYKAIMKDAAGKEIQYVDFAPGEIKSFYFTYSTPDSGLTRIRGVIDTPPLEDRYKEITESDNIVSMDVRIREAVTPVHRDSRLNLQAYSKAGQDVFGNWHGSAARTPFTAKWTDDVKVTLTVDRPSPPRGSLDWWEITWADVTYPKKNPDFQFGDPLPPTGTVEKSMSTPGRGLEGSKSSTTTFEEDWGMDGAQIYNMIRDELMAAAPKNYPISVNFKVTYQYTYTVCRCDEDGCVCWSVTKTDSYTDTARASLTVNGTGVGSYAQ